MTSTAETPAVERVYPPKLMFMVANPLMRWALGTNLGKRVPELARLDFRGRRTGEEYGVVTALHEVDGQTAVLTNSGWRWNFEGGHPVTVVVSGERIEARGRLVSDPDAVARVYLDRIDELGTENAARRLGIKVNVDRQPTHDEIADLARGEGLSVIFLDT